MRAALISVAVGVPAGAIGVGLGVLFDNFVARMGWRGWSMPEPTDEEKELYNLD